MHMKFRFEFFRVRKARKVEMDFFRPPFAFKRKGRPAIAAKGPPNTGGGVESSQRRAAPTHLGARQTQERRYRGRGIAATAVTMAKTNPQWRSRELERDRTAKTTTLSGIGQVEPFPVTTRRARSLAFTVSIAYCR